MSRKPDRIRIADDLEISRIVTGLWQMADQERDGAPIDLDRMADVLCGYAADGFDSFDMADHYGSAELVAGRSRKKMTDAGAVSPIIMTKWCPEPGPMPLSRVRDGIETALRRLDHSSVDLMQLHWWRYEDPYYLDALTGLMRLKEEGLIRHIGLTNFDAAHLRLVLMNGIEIATNQVSFSLLDRRAEGPLSTVCRDHDVKLLAFGTLAGGFMSERWLGQSEPSEVPDWSKMKYMRFISTSGGWDIYQTLLTALDRIAHKHGVSIANVATRWVLDHETVAAVIIGARLGERSHRADNSKALTFEMDAEDRALLETTLAQTIPIPGDCGDEYRKPPFLTASGDLSHHLAQLPDVYPVKTVPAHSNRMRVDSLSEWEAVAGFSRAVRIGERILVSGTTATDLNGTCVCPGDVEGQTIFILDKISAALQALGADLNDVVRTRIYICDKEKWEPASAAHRRMLGEALPANSLVEVAGLVGPYEVEIEAEAIAPDQR